jgi:hypothetical protein
MGTPKIEFGCNGCWRFDGLFSVELGACCEGKCPVSFVDKECEYVIPIDCCGSSLDVPGSTGVIRGVGRGLLSCVLSINITIIVQNNGTDLGVPPTSSFNMGRPSSYVRHPPH